MHRILLVLVLLAAVVAPVSGTVNLQYTTGSPLVLNCDARASTSADCDPEGYRLLLSVIASPGIAGACLVAVFLVLYFISKYLCNCCGGRDQHPNCCCPNLSLPAKYSKGDLLRPRFYAVIVFGLFFGGCVWGLVGATHLRTQVSAMRTSTRDSTEYLQSVAHEAVNTLESVLDSANLSQGTAESLELLLVAVSQSGDAIADELQRMGQETVVPLTRFFNKFLWSAYVVFVLLVVGAVVGLIAAFCHHRAYVPMGLVLFFGVVGGIGGWGVYGAALVGERLLSDACHEVDSYVTGGNSVLVATTGCNDTVFGGLSTSVSAVHDALTAAACTTLWPLCYQIGLTTLQNAAQGRLFDCAATHMDSVDVCQKASLATFMKLPQSAAIWADSSAMSVAQSRGSICEGGPSGSVPSASACTLGVCAEYCVMSPTNRTLSAVATRAAQVLADYECADTVESSAYRAAQISLVSRCDAVLAEAVPPLQAPCSTGTHYAYVVRQSAGLMAWTSVIAMGTYIIGAKRFIPLSEALAPQYG